SVKCHFSGNLVRQRLARFQPLHKFFDERGICGCYGRVGLKTLGSRLCPLGHLVDSKASLRLRDRREWRKAERSQREGNRRLPQPCLRSLPRKRRGPRTDQRNVATATGFSAILAGILRRFATAIAKPVAAYPVVSQSDASPAFPEECRFSPSLIHFHA